MHPSAAPTLVARVRRTIVDRGLARRGDRWLLGVSGGPDSMAMMDVLARLGSELELGLVVASVDHGLRPEAAAEVAFVGERARALDLPFVGLSLGLAPGSGHAEARDARYAALAAAAGDRGCKAVAVAHTQDDQAETVIARLLRGSGLRGLRGVRANRADGVVRPLLDARRDQVVGHLTGHGLPSVSDPSNRDRRFLRVRVREDLLPAWVVESPSIVEHLARIADEAAELAEFTEELAIRFRESAGDELRRDALHELPRPARAAAIAEFVRFHGGRAPGRAVLDAVATALERGGSVWIGPESKLEGRAGSLFVRAR